MKSLASVSVGLLDDRGRAGAEGGLIRAGTILTIDLAAIRANYRLLRDRAAPAVSAAVVKADGYGLGARAVAAALYAEGCRHFFVAHLDEGLSLSGAVPDHAAIYILNGLPPGAEADCAAAGLVPVLNGFGQIEAWVREARRRGARLPAVLQLDSGMSRLGLSPAEVGRLADDPTCFDVLTIAYVMSHLACADEPAHPANALQLQTFETLRRRLPAAPASFANSSGIFLGAAYHFDLVRPGAALYGIAPVPGQPNPMAPVVTLQAKVIQTRAVPAGAFAGYGAAYRAAQTTRLATIALGYADGWPRSLSGSGAAWFRGQRLPFAGRVSMDSIILDISGLPDGVLAPGTFVDLLGPDQTVDAVARDCGTIGYEILTNLGRRHHRVFQAA